MPALQAKRRSLIPALAIALGVASVICMIQLREASGGALRLPLFDYSAFWSASRLTLAGEDPYDPARLAVLQREAEDGASDVLVMWPAPWALSLLLPFSNGNAHVSHLLWLSFEFALLLIAIAGCWRLYGGGWQDFWRAGLAAFTLLPTYFVLVTGQMGVFILLGLAGFLWFLRQGKPAVAGAALVLVAIKPQLLLLFWLALLLWMIETRSWRVAVGGILATAAALAWPLWHCPDLLRHYWVALTQRTQTHSHLSPLVGTALRSALGSDRLWLQFLPLVPGVVWLVWYWRRHRRDWTWPDRLPTLIFASLVAAPYGAWPFDLVILLLPLLQRAVELQKGDRVRALLAYGGFGLINVLVLVQILCESSYFWFLWLTPAYWMCYAFTDIHGTADQTRVSYLAPSNSASRLVRG